ncbi:MAG: hypothetical protein V3T83_21370 [Acidobacteriota bacterium]
MDSQPTENAVECQQCGRTLAAHEERVQTEGGVFCPTCFNLIKDQLNAAVSAQAQDINYSAALLGGLLGGVGGAVVWWGFTALTGIAFGLVAIVIGYAVSRGISYFTGGKRGLQLQLLSVGLASVSYFYATYLVNRSLIHQQFAEEGEAVLLPLLPSPSDFVTIVSLGFRFFDLVFLAIVVWEAWRGLAPLKLAGSQGDAP